MPNKRIAMRKIHDIIMQHFDVGLSLRQISHCADVRAPTCQSTVRPGTSYRNAPCSSSISLMKNALSTTVDPL